MRMSVAIPLGIVAFLALQLSAASSLDQHNVQSDSGDHLSWDKDSKLDSNDISYLEELSYLRHQNLRLMDKLHSLAMSKQPLLLSKNESTSQQQGSHQNTSSESLSIVDHIKNIADNLTQTLQSAQDEMYASLSKSEKEMEKRLFHKLSKTIISNMTNVIMNQSIQGFMKESEELSSLGTKFFDFQKMVFSIFGENLDVSRAFLNGLRNDMKTNLTSCIDYKKMGISTNGFYQVYLEKNSSVTVYCNFTTDSMILYHDQMQGINVTSCDSDSCFRLNLTYSATHKEMKKLINKYAYCEQTIKFGCFHATLEDFGAWYDAFGEKQTYFTGANYGRHICECSESLDKCSGYPLQNKCNCDASSTPSWLEDKGRITNNTALPISGFSYGYLIPGGEQKAFIEIGPLNCTEIVIHAYLENGFLVGNGFSISNKYLTFLKSGNYEVYCAPQGRRNKCYNHGFSDYPPEKKYYEKGEQLHIPYQYFSKFTIKFLSE